MGDDDGRSDSTVLIAIVVAAVLFVGLLLFLVVGSAVLGAFVLEVGEAPSDGEFPPPGGFGADDSEPVTFTRTGEPVDATLVAVTVNGERIGTWADRKDDDGTITDGEKLEVNDAEGGDVVALKWLGSDEPTTLVEVTVRSS